jgi:hypothetical protein
MALRNFGEIDYSGGRRPHSGLADDSHPRHYDGDVIALDDRSPRSASNEIANAIHLVFLAASGATLIIAEPQRTLPNSTFQTKIVLIALAAATTYALRISLRRNAEFFRVSGKATHAAKLLAVSAFILWCAVAAAGRFIAYTQPI